MHSEDRDQSEYYRTIAGEFLKRRGAPLILSPRDMAAIAGWEARRVPLKAVLLGIDRTFEGLRKRGRGNRGGSLALCEREVGRAMEQHQDRSAGGRRAGPTRPAKQERARREVERALCDLSPDDAQLSRLYRTALEALTVKDPEEEALERIEASIEHLLYDRAAPEEKARSVRQARKELPGGGPGEVESLSRTRIVKAMRKKGKVPYVSLYYY